MLVVIRDLNSVWQPPLIYKREEREIHNCASRILTVIVLLRIREHPLMVYMHKSSKTLRPILW